MLLVEQLLPAAANQAKRRQDQIQSCVDGRRFAGTQPAGFKVRYL